MIYLLLVIYQLKHFLADYPLQGKYMLGKFKGGTEWIFPLLAHVLVHGLFTFVIAWFINTSLATPLALFDASVHFIMDRIKASPNMLGKFKALSGTEYVRWVSMGEVYTGDAASAPIPSLTVEGGKERDKAFKSNVFFWWSLGLDQMVHHLTHYVIIWMLVR